MTPAALIKDHSVIVFPSLSGIRTDATTVGDTVFAEVFAALDVTGLRVPDTAGDTPMGLPLVPTAVGEQPEGDDPVTGDVALFAKMMHRAKAGLIVPEAGDPPHDPQAVDAAILGVPEAHLSVLRLIGDPDATDIPVDLDKVVAYLFRPMKGDASAADTALSCAPSEGVPQEAGAVLELGARLEAGVTTETGDDALATSDVELALMQVDGRLAIMVAGALGRISGEIGAYANTIGLALSAPQQTTGQAAPPVGAEGVTLAQASTSPVITATMAVIPPEGRPLTLPGNAGTTSVRAPGLLEKPSVPVAPGVPSAITSQKIDASFAKPVGNSTLKPDSLLATVVSGAPEIRIAGLVTDTAVAGPGGNVLLDGGTFQPASLDAGPKQVAALASLFVPQAGPADHGNVQTAPVAPKTEPDQMYLDIARPNVVSAAPIVIAANMKTGRLLSLEQADSQPSDQRSGLVPHLLPGSEIFGARTADQGRATVARIARGDAPVNTMKDLKPAAATYHRASGQAASDVAGPLVTQSGTQAPASSNGAAPSTAPVAQSSGLPAMLDVRRQGWTRALVQRAADMVQSGGVLTLKILPKHLGQMTLKMSEGRRGLDLRIVTEVASTAAMLRGVENQISSAFEGAGLLLGEFSANSGKGGSTAFGDDGDPAVNGIIDANETDAGMIPDDTSQHLLLNIIL